MTFTASIGLFVAMLVLALLPGPGILVVVSRTLSQGFKAGVVCVFGIVCGDFIFIGLAVFGLSSLAELHSNLFQWVRYLGAIYLIYLGLSLFREKKEKPDQTLGVRAEQAKSLSFFAGLLTTLSNPKAILFYASFFPTFIALDSLRAVDIVVLLIITTLSVGGVMLAYAWVAHRSGTIQSSPRVQFAIRLLSCLMLVGTGAYIALSG